MIRSYLAPGLWLLWLLYLLATTSRGKPSVRSGGGSNVAQVMTLVVAGALLLLPPDLFPGFGVRFLPEHAGLFWTGIGLTALGLFFTAWSRHCMGTNWSGATVIKQDHELVRTGPYALVRHPVYTGLLTAFMGSALVLGQWRGLAAVALAMLAFWRKGTQEERILLQEFGAAYEAYRRRVRAVIPFLL